VAARAAAKVAQSADEVGKYKAINKVMTQKAVQSLHLQDTVEKMSGKMVAAIKATSMLVKKSEKDNEIIRNLQRKVAELEAGPKPKGKPADTAGADAGTPEEAGAPTEQDALGKYKGCDKSLPKEERVKCEKDRAKAAHEKAADLHNQAADEHEASGDQEAASSAQESAAQSRQKAKADNLKTEAGQTADEADKVSKRNDKDKADEADEKDKTDEKDTQDKNEPNVELPPGVEVSKQDEKIMEDQKKGPAAKKSKLRQRRSGVEEDLDEEVDDTLAKDLDLGSDDSDIAADDGTDSDNFLDMSDGDDEITADDVLDLLQEAEHVGVL